MNRLVGLFKKNLKCNITGETLIAIITVFIMWAGYYIDNHYFEDNLIWVFGFWGIGVLVILNVCFPAWWIVKKKGEGFAGMRITTKKLGISVILAIVLGGWRFYELIPYLKDEGLIRIVLFNLLSIWEVCFLFAWLFTRYTKAFGKIGAIILTAVSEVIYHIGTYPNDKILYLALYLIILGICFAVTDNIFTIWPIYWVIGCTANILNGYSSEMFPWEVVIAAGAILFIQLSFLAILAITTKKKSKKIPLQIS